MVEHMSLTFIANILTPALDKTYLKSSREKVVSFIMCEMFYKVDKYNCKPTITIHLQGDNNKWYHNSCTVHVSNNYVCLYYLVYYNS